MSCFYGHRVAATSRRGEWLVAVTEHASRTFTKQQPYTEAVLYERPVSSAADVEEAVDTAAKYASRMRSITPDIKAKALAYTAEYLLKEADNLAVLISDEVGKPLNEAYSADLLTAVTLLKYYARTGAELLKPQSLTSLRDLLLGQTYTLRYQPHGVVGVITPWNYPLGTPTSHIAAALLAGNTVVFKPSELTTASGEKLAHAFHVGLRMAGVPHEVLQVVLGDGETGKALVEHPKVRHVGFTGSEKVGRSIWKACTEKHIECTLELGGSDPVIVLGCAKNDLEAIASYITWGRLTNAGQTCAAVKRVLVHKSLVRRLESLLVEKWKTLRLGDPLYPETQLGPVISRQQQQTVLQQIQAAKDAGDTVIWQQTTLPETGYFVPPTLVQVADSDSPLWQKEAFGPVLSFLTFETEDEAIELANKSIYGLTASIFGSPRRARKLSAHINVGEVAVNGLGMAHYTAPQVPWLGRKASGPGVRNGREGLLAWAQPQVLSRNWVKRLTGRLLKPPYLFAQKPSVKLSKFPLRQMSDPSGLRCLFSLTVAKWLGQQSPGSRL